MISREPNPAVVAFTNFSGNPAEVMSPGMALTCPPALSINMPVSKTGSRSRSLSSTAAPASARLNATARPIPRPAPVTSAVRPFSSRCMSHNNILSRYNPSLTPPIRRLIRRLIRGWIAVLIPAAALAQSFDQRGYVETSLSGFPQTVPSDSSEAVGEAMLQWDLSYKAFTWLKLSGGVEAQTDTHNET